jgi:hypothetical protein
MKLFALLVGIILTFVYRFLEILELTLIKPVLILCGVHKVCGPGSVVSIATGYGLDGPGLECRWGRDFSHLSRPVLGPTQPPVQWVPGLSGGVKSGRGVRLTPHLLVVPLVMKE